MTGAAGLLGLPHAPAAADAALTARFRDALDAPGPVPESADLRHPGREAILAALVAVVPDALARHRREGIPEPVTSASLRDVGRKDALYGADAVLPWLLGILRADVVAVGRLQVERSETAHGFGLHIPETGPLRPEAVDASIAAAVDLTGGARFSCTSWLLDPVLRAELPDSNIAAFATRFTLVGESAPDAEAGEAVCKFVFRRPLRDVRDSVIVPRSRLERLVVERLRGGGGWSQPTGIVVV